MKRVVFLSAVLIILIIKASAQNSISSQCIIGKEKNEIEVMFKMREFIKKDYVIDGLNVYYDDKRVYGAVLELPDQYIKEITIKEPKGISTTIIVDEVSYFTLPNIECINPEQRSLYIDKSTNMEHILLFMNGGDGAGVYSVVWIIDVEKNKLVEYVKTIGDSYFFNLNF